MYIVPCQSDIATLLNDSQPFSLKKILILNKLYLFAFVHSTAFYKLVRETSQPSEIREVVGPETSIRKLLHSLFLSSRIKKVINSCVVVRGCRSKNYYYILTGMYMQTVLVLSNTPLHCEELSYSQNKFWKKSTLNFYEK